MMEMAWHLAQHVKIEVVWHHVAVSCAQIEIEWYRAPLVLSCYKIEMDAMEPKRLDCEAGRRPHFTV